MIGLSAHMRHPVAARKTAALGFHQFRRSESPLRGNRAAPPQLIGRLGRRIFVGPVAIASGSLSACETSISCAANDLFRSAESKRARMTASAKSNCTAAMRWLLGNDLDD